ncbi:MAG: hypothetical protein HRU19_18540 [Pseudobacteriovorax sp.]|nr:hypothetical protein [Pseudobacteriovorax sp.]
MDGQELRKYFSFANVKQGVFSIAEELFDIKILAIPKAATWHEDVTFYEVRSQNKVLGQFYLDLHPRKNKYKHAAQFTLRQGIRGLQLPVPVLVCNFPKTTDSDPGLMEHSQVETFLHEFGHLLHSIFRGHHEWPTSIEWDFIEVPAILLENWVWDAAALKLLAKHHESNQPLPDRLIKKMNEAAKFKAALNNLTQITFAKLSMMLYLDKTSSQDPLSTYKKLYQEIIPFSFLDGDYLPYNFGHLNGYSSDYYTYLWSEVIATDMFSRFKRDGLFNKAVAKDYQEKVLTNTGIKKASELVFDFLGREYNAKAFAESLK